MNSTLYSESYGDGMPLVLLHGWGWHMGIWRWIVPELTQHYRVILIDLPGFGRSPLPVGNYDMTTIAQQLIATVPYPAYWLGWSLGGLIATWLAIHHPQQVSQLITVASSPYFVQSHDWPGTRLATLGQFSLSLIDNFQQTLSNFLSLQLRGSPKELVSQFTSQESELQHFWPSMPSISALRGGLMLLENTDLRSQLTQIQCPSLHIFGSLDAIVPVAVVDRMQALHPQGSYKIIRRAGHMPFLSHKKEFLDELKANLSA